MRAARSQRRMCQVEEWLSFLMWKEEFPITHSHCRDWPPVEGSVRGWRLRPTTGHPKQHSEQRKGRAKTNHHPEKSRENKVASPRVRPLGQGVGLGNRRGDRPNLEKATKSCKELAERSRLA